jgi:cobalt/nickel transport system permease protein
MQAGFLNRYREGTSLVHRLDPRLKLLATLAFVLAATSTPPRAWPGLLLLGGLALAAILAARIPLLQALKRSAIALPFAGMVALSLPFTRGGTLVWAWHPFGWTLVVTDEGLLLFGTVLAKAWLSVLVAGLLVATTRFADLLQALRALHLPAILVTTISFMYRYLSVLVDEALRLQTARTARSVGSGRTIWWRARVLGGMIGSLFIRSYERSERIYAAMLARGLSGEMRSLSRFAWQRRDTWVALAWALALAGATTAGRLFFRMG